MLICESMSPLSKWQVLCQQILSYAGEATQILGDQKNTKKGCLRGQKVPVF